LYYGFERLPSVFILNSSHQSWSRSDWLFRPI